MLDIIIPLGVFLVLGAVIGLLLSVASKVFHVKTDERVGRISECLPGANCGGCGYAGCADLADNIVKGNAKVTACTVGGEAVAEKIAAIMGVKADSTSRMRAQVMCSGTLECAEKKLRYKGVSDCRAAAALGGGEKLCPNGCIGLGTCADVCPFDAIEIKDDLAQVNYMKCQGCGLCVTACPKGIIKLIPYDSKHWVGCSSRLKGIETRKSCDVGCIGCGLCAKNCPEGAITVKDNLAIIDYSLCTGCDICTEKCPRKVIWSAERRGKDGIVISRL